MVRGGQRVRVSEDQLELYFWHAAGRGGGRASFSMMSAFGRTSVDWYTNQSRPHSIIHWLPLAACRTSPLELSDLIKTKKRNKNKKQAGFTV